ncbi:MAG: GNAT family N-acetyltransferase [Prolixibacteraceae bacterium]|nr:GNAT family N-acetyltransferase [Prolixibacteraceae bacterium]
MIKLIPVSNSDDLSDDLKQIYIGSFPPDERRDWQKMKELLQHSSFILNQVFENEELVGLISHWNLPNFLFIEHFAILQSKRGKGIGSRALKQVIAENLKTIIIEVEEPISDDARRRIAFYESAGFSVCEGIYHQPPYSPDKNKVKMLLMSFPEKILPPEFDEIKTRIYREVYQQKDLETF